MRGSPASERPRVLVLASDELYPTFFPPRLAARLEEIADVSRRTERAESPALVEALRAADALVTTWHSPYLRLEALGEPPRPGLVAHCGGEVRARMEDAVVERLRVTNAAEPMARPVAEMALATTLALVRRLPEHASAMRAGAVPRPGSPGRGETLAGRRVGLVGFGRVGRAFARMLAPLGAELAVHDPFADDAEVAAHRARPAALDDLVRESSVVVLAAGLTDETRGLLDRRRLALLADGSILVNVARGGLVDLEALTDELRGGRLSAALDVTDPLEPLPPDHELRRLPNVLLTPHVAGGGLEVREAMGEAVVEEVRRFFAGEPPHSPVTPAMLARMT